MGEWMDRGSQRWETEVDEDFRWLWSPGWM